MIYEPNTTPWKVGDIVIHDADTKKWYMLMRVIGYDAKDGTCITRYVYYNYFPGMGKDYRNDIKYLHDPKQFGIAVEGAA